MKKTSIIFFTFLCVILFTFCPLNAQIIGLEWNTFHGSSDIDGSYCIALDPGGNTIISGSSSSTWGTPVNAHFGDSYDDVMIAKLDSNGNLLWNTFFGGSNIDLGWGIDCDSSGNIYVIGYSIDTWGSPVNPHNQDSMGDIFVVKLDASGNLVWNTFLGSSNIDYGFGISCDSSGNIFLTGHSYASWGSPVNAHAGGVDGFSARLNSSGTLVWNTFFGSATNDYVYNSVLDASGNMIVTGMSNSSWGTPLSSHSGDYDALVVKLNSSGTLQWNTFLGGSGYDKGEGVELDSSGNIYIAGYSNATWGTPVNAHAGNGEAFVAKLDSSGNLTWNTFMGGGNSDFAKGIASDNSGNMVIAGYSNATWGTPVHAHSGGTDALVACLSSSGNLIWHTFLGSSSPDIGEDIEVDSAGNVFVTGYGQASWGTPVHAHSGGHDAFAAKITPQPYPDIRANGSDGPISITDSDTLLIRVSLTTFGSTDNVDFWLAYRGPSGWVHYNNSTKKWESGLGVTHQGALMDLNNKKVFQKSGLAPGNYTFYFGVDMNMDGKITKSSLYKDEVQVTVTSN